jgi:hypothetical protein
LKYNNNTFKQITASNNRLIPAIVLSLLLVTPAYAINSSENAAKLEINSLSNSNISNQNLADTVSFEQNALSFIKSCTI